MRWHEIDIDKIKKLFYFKSKIAYILISPKKVFNEL